MERTCTGFEMTAVERRVWAALVEACDSRRFNTINVAAPDRSEAIIAADRHMAALETENGRLRQQLAEQDEVIPGRYPGVTEAWQA